MRPSNLFAYRNHLSTDYFNAYCSTRYCLPLPVSIAITRMLHVTAVTVHSFFHTSFTYPYGAAPHMPISKGNIL